MRNSEEAVSTSMVWYAPETSLHNGTGKRLNLMIPFSWGLRTLVGESCSVEMVVQLETALVLEIIRNGVLLLLGL